MNIPSTLEKNKEDVYREYYVLRYHNGEVSVIKTLTDDNKTIHFESDKFSSYALVYQDTVVPQTYDNLNTFVIINSLSLISLIGLGYILKKNLANKKI